MVLLIIWFGSGFYLGVPAALSFLCSCFTRLKFFLLCRLLTGIKALDRGVWVRGVVYFKVWLS